MRLRQALCMGSFFTYVACGSLLDENARIARRAAEKDAAANPPRSAAKDLTTFSFQALSTGLSATYTGNISGNTVQVNLPYGVGLTSLIATFTHTGASVSVAGTEQQSGTTANNFSGALTYVVNAQDGSTRAYTVSVFQTVIVQDTGMATCYGMGTTLGSCNDATFPRQDGDFLSTPAARSVEIPTANAGFPADYISRDPVNGIAWKTCTQGLSDPGCLTGTAGSQTQAAGATACSSLNAASGYAGLTTWRLPSALELAQIQHHVTNGVYYDTTRFPGPVNTHYWTSTTLPSTSNAIRVGGSFDTASTGSAHRIRCVAGAAPPAPSWADLGDGTIRDRRTGLYWQKCAVGQTNDSSCTGIPTGATWSASLIACNNLTLAGRSWRMPNITEALSLADFSVSGAPFINAAFVNFPPAAAPTPQMWTSTTAVSNSTYAFVVNYHTAVSGSIDAKNASLTGANRYYARCVSGP